jgi:hypothetical protein
MESYAMPISKVHSLWTPTPKEPIGTPRGYKPGKVVWVWNPDCTDWDGSNYWWSRDGNGNPLHVDQDVLEQMFSDGIQGLTDTTNDSDAWYNLFNWFNNGQGGYSSGEKIAIKINLNSSGSTKDYYYQHNYIDSNPWVIISLLRDLVYIVGVDMSDITVFDCSRPIANWWYNPVHEEFENVVYVDRRGQSGRTKYASSSKKIHFPQGNDYDRYVPTCLTNADYFINVPCHKMHGGGRVTLAGKNLFGAWSPPNISGIHNYMEYGEASMGNQAPQADMLLHEDYGCKTLLALGDSTFGCRNYNYNIDKWQMYPFDNDYPSSLFFSQDTVALDSVLYDFLMVERNGYPWEGAQNYITECADPPSGRYDPEGDGTYVTESLGVHEHWDPEENIFAKERYSGPANDGIEYMAIQSVYQQCKGGINDGSVFVLTANEGEYTAIVNPFIFENTGNKSGLVEWELYEYPTTSPNMLLNGSATLDPGITSSEVLNVTVPMGVSEWPLGIRVKGQDEQWPSWGNLGTMMFGVR